jgi:threonine/homoserine/homoserine lactone efflux protein
MSPEFLLTSLIVVLMPGTGVIYTLSAGLFQGRLASVAAAFGCTAGILPHMAASMLGLAALLHASALASRRSSSRASRTCSTLRGRCGAPVRR